jgi:hypothetical protein
MKIILISIINIYQGFVSAVLKNILGINRMCRYSPTCSEYTKIVLKKEGIFRGLQKSTIRLLKCQPFLTNYGKLF